MYCIKENLDESETIPQVKFKSRKAKDDKTRVRRAARQRKRAF